jgi:hypothetical protein
MPISPQYKPEKEHVIDAFGQRLAARLNGGLNDVGAHVLERLRFVREQALTKRAKNRLADTLKK